MLKLKARFYRGALQSMTEMEEYWRQFLRAGDRGGHFVRRRNDVKNWTVSKAVDALAKEPPRLSFMAK